MEWRCEHRHARDPSRGTSRIGPRAIRRAWRGQPSPSPIADVQRRDTRWAVACRKPFAEDPAFPRAREGKGRGTPAQPWGNLTLLSIRLNRTLAVHVCRLRGDHLAVSKSPPI